MSDSLDRFWSKVEKTPTCWNWLGYIKPNGYGSYTISENKTIYVHRLAFELHRGSIPEGLELDHLCKNRSCVNPDHLEVVNHKENLMRGLSPSAIHSRQTHCKNGHELNEENTRSWTNGKTTMRICKPCDALRHKEYRKNPKIEVMTY